MSQIELRDWWHIACWRLSVLLLERTKSGRRSFGVLDLTALLVTQATAALACDPLSPRADGSSAGTGGGADPKGAASTPRSTGFTPLITGLMSTCQ